MRTPSRSSTPIVIRAGYGDTESLLGVSAVPGVMTHAVPSGCAFTNGAGSSAGPVRYSAISDFSRRRANSSGNALPVSSAQICRPRSALSMSVIPSGSSTIRSSSSSSLAGFCGIAIRVPG